MRIGEWRIIQSIDCQPFDVNAGGSNFVCPFGEFACICLRRVAVPHMTKLSSAAGVMGTDCTNQDAAKCRTDANAVSSESRSFLNDIGKLTVPACLSSTNLELGTALELLIDGDTEAIAGIDANNATRIEQGAQLITLATTHLTKANKLLDAHPCG